MRDSEIQTIIVNNKKLELVRKSSHFGGFEFHVYMDGGIFLGSYLSIPAAIRAVEKQKLQINR